MLVRAYRLTDKIGLVMLKSSAALSHIALVGVEIITSRVARVFGGLFALVVGIVMVLFRLARRLAVVIWGVLRFLYRVFLRLTGVGQRVSGSTIGVGRRSLQDAMARRAARSEMESGLAEDPLRAQNRVLSALLVILLVALTGVVLWATNPARSGGASLPPDVNNPNFSFVPATSDAVSTSVPVSLSTPVPTATALPAVLEVRGSLAYKVRERGQDDIWVLSVGSRTPIRITNSPADDRDPAWSHDGRKLAYTSRQDGNWDIYVYDMATGEITRMTVDLAFQGGPHWSPDSLWLVYESYQGNNLDIYVMPVDFSQPAQRVTSNPAPDFSPVWSPDGRRIAFVSWRDGNQDIYVFSLDNPNDQAVVNLTNTPDRQEDNPVWSPDGKLIAYSAVDGGLEKVFVKPSDDPQSPAQVLDRGRAPAWSPNGESLVFAVDSIESTQLVVSPFAQSGVSTLIVSVPLGASDPSWTSAPLPAALVNSGGKPLGVTQSLYIEQQNPPDSDGLYKLGQLLGVSAESPYLSERVNDSFNALREQTLKVVGWDFLSELEDAFWQINRPPQPGEERQNWYMTGRQFGVNRNLIVGFPAQMEVVREDLDVNTYWRIYVRVADEAQSGQLGEPLRRMPWDVLSRNQGDVEAYDQGGRLKSEVPSGYYVDFTQVAADYGWLRVPAGSDWRANFNSVNYWLFRKADGLTWLQAMRELYTQGQLGGFAPTLAPTVIPTPEATQAS